jgi:hypothetical protein
MNSITSTRAGQLPVDARGDVVAAGEQRATLGVALVDEDELAGRFLAEPDERHQEVALHEIDGTEQHAQIREIARTSASISGTDLHGHRSRS